MTDYSELMRNLRKNEYVLARPAADALEAQAKEIEKLNSIIEGAFQSNLQHCRLEDAQSARIAELEATLKKLDALIKHQYTGSIEAMSDMHTCAQETAKLLYDPTPAALNGKKKLRARIEELEKENASLIGSLASAWQCGCDMAIKSSARIAELEVENKRLRGVFFSIPPIELDEQDPSREYIPLPAGERHSILVADAAFVREVVTRMAKEMSSPTLRGMENENEQRND